jgi:nicotinamidase-related amidase
MKSVVLTQCLQVDYLDEAGSSSSVFVGPHESRRVVRHMRDFVARARARSDVAIVHIRDWHDPIRDAAHFAQFGPHCQQNTPGAELIVAPVEGEIIVNGNTLNDALDTNLMAVLAKVAAPGCRVAVMGCWSEAKVSFLLYELKSRHFDVATSTALCASGSFDLSFEALSKASKVLGIPLFNGVSDLLSWVTFDGSVAAPLEKAPDLPKIESTVPLSDEETLLVKLCLRQTQSVSLMALSGGYRQVRDCTWFVGDDFCSGAKVFRTIATDLSGR